MSTVKDYIKNYSSIISNPVEFLRYCKIKDYTTGDVIDYEVWPHLVDLFRLFLSSRQIILLKPKQVGISYALAMYGVWRMMSQMASHVVIISAGQMEANELLDKAKFAFQNLPDGLRLPMGANAASYFEIPAVNSKMVALPSTPTPGIGATATLVICDEWDFHDYPEEDFATAKPMVDAGGQFIGVSTSNYSTVDSFFKQMWRKARDGKSNFTPIFLPWNVRPGRDADWYDKTKLDYPDFLFRKNYPKTEEEALSPVSGRSLFDEKILQKLMDGCREPLETRIGCVHIFQRPKVGIKYYAGGDVAEGRGGDNSILWVEGQDGLQRELAAIIQTNQMTTDLFGYQVYELLKEYLNPYLVMGNDPLGLSCLDILVKMGYRNMFYADKKREKPGYTESVLTRQTNLVNFERAVREGLVVRYKPAVLEMFNFQATDKGRFEAAGGAHDDCVSAGALANVAQKFGGGTRREWKPISYMRTR